MTFNNFYSDFSVAADRNSAKRAKLIAGSSMERKGSNMGWNIGIFYSIADMQPVRTAIILTTALANLPVGLLLIL